MYMKQLHAHTHTTIQNNLISKVVYVWDLLWVFKKMIQNALHINTAYSGSLFNAYQAYRLLPC